MSIVTKTGDQGSTGLMYNRRVPKTHLRVETYGSVDELNAALGLARANSARPFIRENLEVIQKDLVILMGELATDSQDLARYVKDGFEVIRSDHTAKLERFVREIESHGISYKGWATPGATVCAGALDLARTTCRRAERRVWQLHESGECANTEIMVFLNRLSDLLWLMARWEESQQT